MGKFCEKVPFLVLRKKKRKEATKTFCPQITTSSSSYTRTEYYTYIIFIKADILLSISFPASATTTTTTTTCGGVAKRKSNNTRGEERDKKAFDHQSEQKKQSNLK